MKKITFSILVSILLFQGCAYKDFNPMEWAVDPILELSKTGVVFTAAKHSDTIVITSNYNVFEVSCEDSWCIIQPNIADSTIVIEVQPNMNAEQRSTTVYVHVGRDTKQLTKTFSVVQMGGYWDVIDQFTVYWSSNVTNTQKETIAEILSNMVYVKGGMFVMGTNDYWGDTRHNVTLSDFFINKTEVTQKQWNVIMGRNNSCFKRENLPVENITWEEAINFVSKLSILTNLNFTLPTEAQWEYAARGGIYSMGYLYPGSNEAEEVFIYKGNENLSDPSFSTYEVGSLYPNELGLYNMAGNVAEICLDWYGDYELTDQVDPIGPATGKYHVKRGGDITDLSIYCTVYFRQQFITEDYSGIRLCIRP